MKQAHIFISGHVQGVWYRKFVKTNAVKLGLTGWVKNTQDNRVEAVLQSTERSDQEGKELIGQMIELCRVGPPFAEIKNVEVVWEDQEEEFKDFMII